LKEGSERLSRVRRLIKRTVIAGILAGALSAAITQFLPRTYRSEAKILPSAGGGPSGSIVDLASAAGITELIGGSFRGSENPALTYPEIIASPLITERTLLRTYPLTSEKQTVLSALDIEEDNPRKALFQGRRLMAQITTINANPRSGLISVSVVTQDSLLSAYIVSSLLEELDRFNVETRASRGRATREFIERRFKEAGTELTVAEAQLTAFRSSNLRIGNSPNLLLEQARLERQVEFRADTYRLLARQFELARIEERRDTPTFTVIEHAQPPYRKYRPSTVINTMVAFFGVVGMVLGANQLAQAGIRLPLAEVLGIVVRD